MTNEAKRSEESDSTVRLGARVNTPLGCGRTVGKEEFFNDYRWLVKLDDPSRWAFGKETDVAAFFRHEVVPNKIQAPIMSPKPQKSQERLRMFE